jgi:hypothetical protein
VPKPVQIIARLACIATWLAAADKPFLRIISPVNGAVVRPGQKLLVKVTGAGEYPGILVLGGELAGEIQAPMGKAPWVIPIAVSLEVELGKTSLTAISTTLSGTEVESNIVEIDVEPVGIPPVEFSHQAVRSMSVGDCLIITNESPCSGLPLMIYGTYPDGTVVSLNRSTRLKPVSLSPSVVAVSKDGYTLLGVSPGTATIMVFTKYAIDIKVFGTRQ